MRSASLVLFCSLCAVTGCATAPGPHALPAAGVAPAQAAVQAPAAPQGFYHTALRGQTLWRISKIYNVDLEQLAAANKIEDATRIETGQKIFIPSSGAGGNVCLLAGEEEDFLWPLKGTVLRDGIPGHKGLNIAPKHSDEVAASKSGTVVFVSDNLLDIGRTVIIDHHDGFLTVYARLAQVMVANGDSPQRGAVIATAGSSARDSRKYLHFEIRKAGVAQNPYLYITD